jgi:hypothetical protein
MNTDLYKERNKQIIKTFIALFIILGFFAALFYVSFYGSDLSSGLWSTIGGVIFICLSIVTFIKAKRQQIASDYRVVAILMLASGLLNLYSGVHKILRFLN